MEDQKLYLECGCGWPEHTLRLVTFDFEDELIFVDFAISGSLSFRDRLKEAWAYLWRRNHLHWREASLKHEQAEQLAAFLQNTIPHMRDEQGHCRQRNWSGEIAKIVKGANNG